jgi:F-box protein 9
MDNSESELESFRRQWRQEVSARNQAHNAGGPSSQAAGSSTTSRQSFRRKAAPAVPSGVHAPRHGDHDLLEPISYHDLGEKELGRRIDDPPEPTSPQEPKSALDHYEKAVEQETKGKLGDSMHLYRRAFKVGP